MRVSDVMTRSVISVGAGKSVVHAIRLMLQNRISGLPVVDEANNLIGMLTEGDFLRRGETGTQRQRPKWLEFLIGPGRLAEEYVRTSGRQRIDEVMTRGPITVTEDAPLETVVELMERHRIKRLPVVRDGKMVGIVSRANLMHALVGLARDAAPAPAGGDAAIRDRILAAFREQSWAPQVNVVVKKGAAELWGTITDDRERQTYKSSPKMSRASPGSMITLYGSSRCREWHFLPPKMKLTLASRHKTPFIDELGAKPTQEQLRECGTLKSWAGRFCSRRCSARFPLGHPQPPNR